MPTKVATPPESRVQLFKRLADLEQQRENIEQEIAASMSRLMGHSQNGHHVAPKVIKTTVEQPESATSESATPKTRRPRQAWNPPEPTVVESSIKIFAHPGKGRKQCPNEACAKIISARSENCVCGWIFKKKKMGTAVASAKPNHERAEELKESVMRALKHSKKPLSLPEMTGRILDDGVKVHESVDVESCLNMLVEEKVVKYDAKEQTWLKVD